ncbi:MAG TPA: LytTR family DNA-binding domain-containing protein [Steroidobacteraceae bacterium]|nr:LytTR family DNA-binding domain-containing protein [Steroidobacteraceae bacterium]
MNAGLKTVPLQNVLIVDDEPLARDGMVMLLREEPGVGPVTQARNGAEALTLLRATPFDLVFLDVQMPEMDGFGVLKEIGAERMPPVIFVTAHDQYAIKAFEVNAIDYLLKPVTRERCSQALARVRERISQGAGNDNVLSLLQQLASPPSYLARVALRTGGRISFVNVEDILYVQAAENYVQLNLKAARHLLHVPIATLEASLDPQDFLRIHRSIIVNVRHVKELETGPHGEYIVVLPNGTKLQSSRSYHEKIKKWAANPF